MGSKYSTEEMLLTVKKVIDEKSSIKQAARDIGIHKSEVQKWVAAYRHHGIAGIERVRIVYTGEFKQTVVEDMRNNNLSYRETAAKYNVGDHSVVSNWEQIYLDEGPEGLYLERRGRIGPSGRLRKERPPKLDKDVENDLIAENQRLRAEVDYLKKLNALVHERETRERRPK